MAFSVSDGKETVHRDRSALTRRANTYVHTTLCIRHILRYTMERRISPPSLTNGEYGEREGYRRLYGDNSPEGIALLRHCGFSLDGSGRLGERCVGVLEDLHDAQTAAALLGVRFMKEGYMAEREASRGSASSVEHDSESDVRNMGPAYITNSDSARRYAWMRGPSGSSSVATGLRWDCRGSQRRRCSRNAEHSAHGLGASPCSVRTRPYDFHAVHSPSPEAV